MSKELWFSEDPNVAETLVFKDVSYKININIEVKLIFFFVCSGLDQSASKCIEELSFSLSSFFYIKVWDLILFFSSTVYQDISKYEVIEDASGSDLETEKIKLLLNKSVSKLNVEDHTVTLDDGSVINYNKVRYNTEFLDLLFTFFLCRYCWQLVVHQRNYLLKPKTATLVLSVTFEISKSWIRSPRMVLISLLLVVGSLVLNLLLLLLTDVSF